MEWQDSLLWMQTMSTTAHRRRIFSTFHELISEPCSNFQQFAQFLNTFELCSKDTSQHHIDPCWQSIATHSMQVTCQQHLLGGPKAALIQSDRIRGSELIQWLQGLMDLVCWSANIFQLSCARRCFFLRATPTYNLSLIIQFQTKHLTSNVQSQSYHSTASTLHHVMGIWVRHSP